VNRESGASASLCRCGAVLAMTADDDDKMAKQMESGIQFVGSSTRPIPPLPRSKV